MPITLQDCLFGNPFTRDGVGYRVQNQVHRLTAADPMIKAAEACIIMGWTQDSIEAFWEVLRAKIGVRMSLCDSSPPEGWDDFYLPHDRAEIIKREPEANRFSGLDGKNPRELSTRLDEIYQRQIGILRMEGDPRLPHRRERMGPALERLLAYSVPLSEDERAIQRDSINKMLRGVRDGERKRSLHLLALTDEYPHTCPEGIALLGERVFRGWENAGDWVRLMVATGADPKEVAEYLLAPTEPMVPIGTTASSGGPREIPLESRIQALWATQCFMTFADLFDAVRPGLPIGTLPDTVSSLSFPLPRV